MRERAGTRGRHAPLPPEVVVTQISRRIGVDGDASRPAGMERRSISRSLCDERIRAAPVSPHGEGWIANADGVLESSLARADTAMQAFRRLRGLRAAAWRDADYLA